MRSSHRQVEIRLIRVGSVWHCAVFRIDMRVLSEIRISRNPDFWISEGAAGPALTADEPANRRARGPALTADEPANRSARDIETGHGQKTDIETEATGCRSRRHDRTALMLRPPGMHPQGRPPPSRSPKSLPPVAPPRLPPRAAPGAAVDPGPHPRSAASRTPVTAQLRARSPVPPFPLSIGKKGPK